MILHVTDPSDDSLKDDELAVEKDLERGDLDFGVRGDVGLDPGRKHPAAQHLPCFLFVATALVSQLIGYLALSYALGHLAASIVSPTMVLQPVITAILAIPLLGEIPTLYQGVGGAIALLGIYLVNRSHQTKILETPNA